MPELPEAETARRGLIWIGGQDHCRGPVFWAQATDLRPQETLARQDYLRGQTTKRWGGGKYYG